MQDKEIQHAISKMKYEILSGCDGSESYDWSLMMFLMYFRWASRNGYSCSVVNPWQHGRLVFEINCAPELLKSEIGIHRLRRASPHDNQNRRHTSFGIFREYGNPTYDSNPVPVRNYVQSPYSLVKDLRTGLETKDVDGVFGGRIEPFLENDPRSTTISRD